MTLLVVQQNPTHLPQWSLFVILHDGLGNHYLAWYRKNCKEMGGKFDFTLQKTPHSPLEIF